MTRIPTHVPMTHDEALELSKRVTRESSGELRIRLHETRAGVVLNLGDGSTVRDAEEWETHPRNARVFRSRQRATERAEEVRHAQAGGASA